MTLLPNGCKCSELKVNPANWESPKASIRKPWFIYYRFYDPQQKESYPKGKLRVIKGMNETKTLEERQTLVRALISVEMNQLKNLGFNPISERHELPISADSIVHPATPFIQALRQAFGRANYAGQTFLDIRSVLKYIEKAAVLLRFDYIPVKDIRPSHLLLLLDQCGTLKEKWTGNNYNTYVKYLSMLFGHLLQYRAVEFNPARDIKKKKPIKNHRSILTPEECREIDQFTREYDERLWMFIHIFFHSGSRTTEILRVQGEHVNLKKQK